MFIWSGREDLNLRPPGPEYGRLPYLSFIFNSLRSYQLFSFLPKHAHSGLMGDLQWVTQRAQRSGRFGLDFGGCLKALCIYSPHLRSEERRVGKSVDLG